MLIDKMVYLSARVFARIKMAYFPIDILPDLDFSESFDDLHFAISGDWLLHKKAPQDSNPNIEEGSNSNATHINYSTAIAARTHTKITH